MVIEDIIKQKDYLNFRKLKIGVREIEVIIRILKEPKGIVTFTPFLQSRSELPDELLPEILLAGAMYKPLRYTFRWMPALYRIFNLKKINVALFNLIENAPSIGQKCKLISLFETIELSTFPELWHPAAYAQVMPKYQREIYDKIDKIINDAELRKQINKESRFAQMDFLTKEFYENENIVYRCHISCALHSEYDQDQVSRIRQTMQEEKIPMTYYELEIVAKQDKELERIIYEELNWKR